MESAFDRIVAVDDCDIYIGKCCDELLGCEFLELDVERVLYDIFYCCVDARIVLELDDAFLCEKEECSCFVCYVVRNSDNRTVLKVLKILDSASIDAEWFVVDCAY